VLPFEPAEFSLEVFRKFAPVISEKPCSLGFGDLHKPSLISLPIGFLLPVVPGLGDRGLLAIDFQLVRQPLADLPDLLAEEGCCHSGDLGTTLVGAREVVDVAAAVLPDVSVNPAAPAGNG
jgi:hypothetical protein